MLKRATPWVSSMSYIGKTCRKHWPNITSTSTLVGETIVLSGSSGRRGGEQARHARSARLARNVAAESRIGGSARLARRASPAPLAYQYGQVCQNGLQYGPQ